MSISSIDDIVEQAIRHVILGMGNLARRIRLRCGAVASHLRRIAVVIALVIASFLFRPQFILALAVSSFVLGLVPLWIERAIRDLKGRHTTRSATALAQAKARQDEYRRGDESTDQSRHTRAQLHLSPNTGRGGV